MPDFDPSTPPGWPGIPPRWTSSAKNGVGASLDARSQVWFTISHGILNEIYFPRVDQACTRDIGMLVTDGADFFSEEKRHTRCQVLGRPGIPAFQLTNSCVQGRYRIEKEILADPARSVVLQRTVFHPAGSQYRLYVLAAPHLGNRGYGNTAWAGDYKGVPMLFAERNGIALALASSAPWARRSVGYVGSSDGWQDLNRHKRMLWEYTRAENGNVAMTGEIDLSAGYEFVLAIGFGGTWQEAAQMAQGSLYEGFHHLRARYVQAWEQWHDSLLPLDQDWYAASGDRSQAELYRVSTSVLRCHHSKMFHGGIIASLSIPWGFSKGDDDLGGYHLVWPRDLVETAGGLVAAGEKAGALHVLEFLQVTQELDGHWPQNMWLDGAPYWTGVQMDETAFPILLADLLRREGCLDDGGIARFWPMVRRASSYLVSNGPVTGQDRWEEDPGYSPFTLAVEIAALVVAADLADLQGEHDIARYLLETADVWFDTIDRWTYVVDSELARQYHIDGYYIRIAPDDQACAASPAQGFVPIKNRPPADGTRADHLISPDFLALVRFGLRAPDDPRVLNTLKLVDAMLKVEAPQGPLWRRYNGDGYGEHEDGSAFDGTGVGRLWPLLTGERAHYELAAGNRKTALSLLRTLAQSADDGGLLPEQTWDAPDIPDRELFFGKPSGSARPLVWAHAEYVKLLRSLLDGRVFDQPPQLAQRYLREQRVFRHSLWSLNNKTRYLCAGRLLRISLTAPARVRWSLDSWVTVHESYTQPTGLGTHIVDLPTDRAAAGTEVVFTFYWLDRAKWEGANYSVLAG